MISHQYECILVKVPKTAGTSISLALNCAHILKPHRDIQEIKHALEMNPKIGCSENKEPVSNDAYNEYFKFGFVRNPWSRVVSLYNRKEGIQPSEKMNFDEFVNTINYSSDACVHPSRHKHQLDWFTDLNGEVAVDFIGKFENMESDWQNVCEKLSINIKLPHTRKNPFNQRPYQEYYTDITRGMIGDKFQVDIEYFNYEFDQ